MKYNVEKLILWLKNGKKRELEFKPNKVNVITGDSNTGKTAILEIIDYCYFASKSKISESIINENVSWYGLRININDKKYTIGRKGLFKGKTSNEYYFSSIGEIPKKVPESNNTEVNIKSLIETEFSIDKSVSFPIGYGSNNIRVGSKISLRYFLMFNTISQDLITNSQGIFFDKQNEPRYRDALPRIFDIATGIEKVENILKKEKKIELEKKLIKLKRKESEISKKSEYFQREQKALVKKAKEFSLINPDTVEKDAISELKDVVKGAVIETGVGIERGKLEKERNIIKRKIKNLRDFINEYSNFKKNITDIEDSLKPINFIEKEANQIIKTENFKNLISQLSIELNQIKEARKAKTPIDKQVLDEISELTIKLTSIELKLESLPRENKNFKNDKNKYIFIGEVKTKLNLYTKSDSSPSASVEKEIEKYEKELNSLFISDTEEKRELTIKLIEEIIREYMITVEKAMGNYKNFLPEFDYKNKSLLLRKPKETFYENVGSSSNHMFLHLFFSLAMQEIIYKNNSPYVAPFIVIDQPSRPYYGDDGFRKLDEDNSDDYKITQAFKLLDKFIEERKKNKGEFQMIVFEHISQSLFKDMKNIHLVDSEFRNGNALIPLNMI
ncbi:DUF3732 domain-containing protein [Tenacibaculum finnmarkense genomovar ulcerans]|uniref:DUF3732 domain-containing protein n=1 Tax=Tenacibaculum finnmarkense TaxID=2781243 RepID=UPI001E58E5AE|nr:DUF3732 domain-containing protein [Tenacibaculum finnmarkense]MCD8453588.1 DUF3732 domain-containing protein [Tenacibaculum finnmarkense genomovar ulcerans]